MRHVQQGHLAFSLDDFLEFVQVQSFLPTVETCNFLNDTFRFIQPSFLRQPSGTFVRKPKNISKVSGDLSNEQKHEERGNGENARDSRKRPPIVAEIGDAGEENRVR